ncbi:DUF2911 domain-containing protein [Chryseolinea soli]|uniref:DUF2911 domain-containing protein n=1 Tax=Chryseolinea soli TaxID=2321403 RepID=A0A385SJQ3_9BACT|nr:DUF2911 domain-containing protein [Chryseolinea soli]AYB30696.1 DUF2911 domain-containing protein [Chryseolinea soli]
MKKFLVIAGIAVTILIILGVVTNYFLKKHTKSFSPEEETVFKQDALEIKVFYNRPYKKGRQIFGSLVPYGKVWRTGANEATTFETNKDIEFENQKLKKGKYSLWTIPGEETWTIIFNSEYGQWGIGPGGEANRDPEKDVLKLDVHSVQSEREFEQFTISFEKTGAEAEMVLIWDKTLVAVPFWQ